MKRILTLVMSLVMVFSLSVSAFAASPDTDTPKSYTINIDGQVITFDEGETVSVPLTLTEEGKQLLAEADMPRPYVAFPGDAGVLNVWGEGTRFHWSIVMSIPATSFSGEVSGVDLNSGFSSGTAAVSGFSGSCAVGHIIGHQYGASISGTAFNGLVPVAKTVSNWIYWRS